MKISKIKDNDVANGLGISMSVWTQGCPHHCEGCFNKVTWSYDDGREFTNDDLNYIIKNINKDNVERNLSVLGGEPLCPENVEGVINLCKTIREVYPNKKIYVWTGYTYEEFNSTQKEIVKYVDVIIDGKFEKDKKDLSLMLRGSSNQRIIKITDMQHEKL
jgi:anaerobic ribonucleoside-triphosphate reductase activating protein